ncbi:MAG: chorismate mutase [Bacteroidia bacterium]|nr:chorismate mutase [Bacteroidia bacterium]MDW8345970.1 chorismate mutase [Bacteroidia bacterium]
MNTNLQILREKIQEIDRSMMILLAQRLQYAEQIGKIKRQMHIPYQDPAYFEYSLRIKEEYGKNLGLTIDEVKVFFELLQELSINRMKKDVSL